MVGEGRAGGATHRWVWRALALVLCALLLASVARFYHRGVGFSALLVIARDQHQIPALRDVPHYEYAPTQGYDGAFYVQLAMAPLLRDPEIDRALDAPAYRARRILFSWTAWALGLGKPAWILQAYALQNVLCWLALGWLLTRWLPPDRPRLLALWAASMFSHGLIASVRLSLLDGPSLLLLVLAVAALERGRTWLTAGINAIAGLGRETDLLGAAALPRPRGWRGWLRALAALVVIALPLLVWQDYVWSLYRGTSLSAGSEQITVPFTAFAGKWLLTLSSVSKHGFTSAAGPTLLVMIALTVQTGFIMWTRAVDDPWWRLAAVFAVLMMLVRPLVWEGYPGAVTRVVLPLTFGFNVVLARLNPARFWWWAVLGNLDIVASLHQMPIVGIPPPF
ncbi:MAG: hypothetical protein A3H96_01520 [Acidobacteria bacterium RIFCSPLOWO2_02_FULL_67_36]|nr:MAG: hypothetical protein A3H96_01520 [Acidobacteria bacterium RIFCSPLOWO2_02_FULL_67_36]OFW26221.1 MAG: hypothetical protein A3G21_20815 [Acidobacteria bacterium RIFCSPLOWO2_12_FULL_66_21]